MRIIIIFIDWLIGKFLITFNGDEQLLMRIPLSLRLSVLLAMALMASVVRAGDEPTFHLVLKDHQFNPANITVPAHTRVKLIVENQQDLPAEFESFPLNREKVVTGHNKIVIYLSPMDPGTYTFFDDFHRETKGTVTAK